MTCHNRVWLRAKGKLSYCIKLHVSNWIELDTARMNETSFRNPRMKFPLLPSSLPCLCALVCIQERCLLLAQTQFWLIKIHYSRGDFRDTRHPTRQLNNCWTPQKSQSEKKKVSADFFLIDARAKKVFPQPTKTSWKTVYRNVHVCCCY